jgi:acid phosphatase family membrane protein YuiD
MFIRSNRLKWQFRSLTSYSGMPSGHAAMIVSLATIVGLSEGFASALFGVSLIIAILIIRDALGLRRYLGQHGKMLNELIKDLDNDHVLDHKYPHLLERIGHTPTQVIAGALLGIAVSLTGYLITLY